MERRGSISFHLEEEEENQQGVIVNEFSCREKIDFDLNLARIKRDSNYKRLSNGEIPSRELSENRNSIHARQLTLSDDNK